jgi:hypothetical protein
MNFGTVRDKNKPEMFESLASCFAFSLQRFAQHDGAAYEVSCGQSGTAE